VCHRSSYGGAGRPEERAEVEYLIRKALKPVAAAVGNVQKAVLEGRKPQTVRRFG
jgi:hypothetical protein